MVSWQERKGGVLIQGVGKCTDKVGIKLAEGDIAG